MDQQLDQIHLTGIRCYGYIGAFPEEQVLGQWFEVELKLWLDLDSAGQSDRLEDTLNYGAVVMQVQQLVKTSRVALLERLATTIAETLLQTPSIQQVQVRLSKLAAPIPDFDGRVTIDLTRTRP